MPDSSSSSAPTSATDTIEVLSKEYVKLLRALSCAWSSHNAAKQLTPELIDYIRPRIHRCSTPLKVRILTSLLYISPALLHKCSSQLSYLLNSLETDRDDWVRKLSRLLQPYVLTGFFDLREIDTETAYRIIKYLDEHSTSNEQPYRLKPPLEHTRVFNVTSETPRTTPQSYPPDISYLLKIPPPSPLLEQIHYHALPEALRPMCELETHGLYALARELKQFEVTQKKNTPTKMFI